MGFMTSQQYTITTGVAKDLFAALALDNPSNDVSIPSYRIIVQNNNATGIVWFGELSVLSSAAYFGIQVPPGHTCTFDVPSGVRAALRADGGGSNVSSVNVTL